jgi:branched-subunit amino acid aminotransferase/4-amino-4-deoxychorismate lyase
VFDVLYVNGAFQPLDRPALRARDRAVLHGEAVYEGVKIVERRPLFLEPHLVRLAESAAALGIVSPWDMGRAREVLARLLPADPPHASLARLFLTAGEAGGDPTALAWIEPLPAWAAPGTPPRRLVCHPERIVPYRPEVKHTSRLAHGRARSLARAAGADDALLVHRDGWVLEGTASNVFFFEADTLHTPERGCGILAGITRDVALALAPGCGFKTVEGRYPPAVVAAADECFLTFTSGGIQPVAALDGSPFPAPVPGPRGSRLRAAYDDHVAAALAATPELDRP